MRSILLLCIIFTLTVDNAFAQNAIGNWTNLGPVNYPLTGNNGYIGLIGIGRTNQVKFHPTDSLKMYAVTTTGLFISNNNGQNWTTTGADQLPEGRTASVCIDYTNDSILYLGTGDPAYYIRSYGIWKSIDAGVTWNPIDSNIGYRLAMEIIMSPVNHNILVAATDDGIWKTTNGGIGWTETRVGGYFGDLKQKPGSNTILYASTDSAFFKSTDFGSTWTQITNGVSFPAYTNATRLAVSTADTNVVYLATTAPTYSSPGNPISVVLRSGDGGQSFTTVYDSAGQCLVCYGAAGASCQSQYNIGLGANPQNANEVVLVSQYIWRSTDGGHTWTWTITNTDHIHVDKRQIIFNPHNNNQRFCATDGGLFVTTDSL